MADERKKYYKNRDSQPENQFLLTKNKLDKARDRDGTLMNKQQPPEFGKLVRSSSTNEVSFGAHLKHDRQLAEKKFAQENSVKQFNERMRKNNEN